MSRIVASIIAVAATSAVALAAPGDLDPSWGGGGVVTTVTTRGGSNFIAASLDAIAYDRGRIWVSGTSTRAGFIRWNDRTGGRLAPLLVRYTSQGRLDRSFGRDGIVRLDGAAEVFALKLVLPGGRLLVQQASGRGWTLSRYHAHGALDRAFGRRGVARLTVGGCRDHPVDDVIRRPDGKLVGTTVGCRARKDERSNVHELIQFDPSGRVDRSFGQKGIASAHVGKRDFNPDQSPQKLVRQRSGRLVSGGVAAVDGPERRALALVGFTPRGRLDATFGSGGTALYPMAAGTWFGGLVKDELDRIVIAGCDESQRNAFVLVRYTPDGKLDATWGRGGVINHGNRFGYGVNSVECPQLQAAPGGKLLVLGSRLARLNADGTLDATFGNGGIVRPRAADHVLVQPDGRIVLAAKLRQVRARAFRLVRYRG